MKNRKSGKLGQIGGGGNGNSPFSLTDHEYEESWKTLMNNKNIVWEEWIFINNCDLNHIKDEMKRACLIKQLETFILYYNKHPCVFSIGLTLRYSRMLKLLFIFGAAK